MTREQYIYYRKANDLSILYEWYKEHFDSNKHRPFITNVMELVQYLQIWTGNIGELFNRTIAKYDEKFNIVLLFNKEGQLIDVL